MKIFLFDDDNTVEALITLLRRNNHDVDWVANYEDAIYYLDFEPGYSVYDFLIFDISILGRGRYGGWEFVKEFLKEHPERQDKIVLYSARIQELNVDELRNYPQIRLLDKTKDTLYEDASRLFS